MSSTEEQEQVTAQEKQMFEAYEMQSRLEKKFISGKEPLPAQCKSQRNTFIEFTTPENVSPQTYSPNYHSIEPSIHAKIKEAGAMRDQHYLRLCEQFHDPGLYQVLRNPNLREIKQRYQRVRDGDAQDYIQENLTLVSLTQKKAFVKSPARATGPDSRGAFLSKSPTPAGVSPQSYHPRSVDNRKYQVFADSSKRLLDSILASDESVSPAAYTLPATLGTSRLAHDICHDNRVNRWYLERLGFCDSHKNDEYYIRLSRPRCPSPKLYGSSRFKPLDKRRENIFLGPGSHQLARRM